MSYANNNALFVPTKDVKIKTAFRKVQQVLEPLVLLSTHFAMIDAVVSCDHN